MYVYKYVNVCVYIYICIYKLGPGVDSGSQPLSVNKKIRPEHDPSINRKTQCPKPNP